MAGDIRQFRTNKWSEPGQLRMLLDEPPKKRAVPWFWLLVAAVMLLGFGAVYLRHDLAGALKPKSGTLEALSADQIQVVDGDTIRLQDRPGDIHLLGFNTPETERANCDAERERGYAAMRRLRAIVERAELQFQSMACVCPPNMEDIDACRADQRCGILRANGWDVGERLIAEGLAVRTSCTGANCSVPAQPWCDAG